MQRKKIQNELRFKKNYVFDFKKVRFLIRKKILWKK